MPCAGKPNMPQPDVFAGRTARRDIHTAMTDQTVTVALPNGEALETRMQCGRGKTASVIYHIAASGRRKRWKPGRTYAAGSMWHADNRGNIYGFDFYYPRRVYICRADGRHVATLTLSLHRHSLLRPSLFGTGVRGIRYLSRDGKREFLSWEAVERRLRRRRGAGYARHAMYWLTGRVEAGSGCGKRM